MDDRLWQRADDLLGEALDLPPEERAGFVTEAAAGDSELAALVQRLLDHAEAGEGKLAPGQWLSPSIGRDLLDGGAEAEEAAASTGSVVGRYRILGELGRGGMAVVYRAERVDGGFEQQVALKQIRLGFDNAEGVRRFERERQILARATHPDVARLLDGGVGPDGRPFLVMELVAGEPIDQHCDRKRLTVRERLGLFLRVARAVEYAHRNLVVHRDLKPSNILVTDDGHPKLLDFGIAGLLAGPEADAVLTRHDLRPMTPAYASPEQVRGEPVTTLSDVYQLGLLLYLLLTGRTPYRQEDSPTPLALARAISEEPPTRPSWALRRPPGEVGGPGTLAEEAARMRRTSPARLVRLLEGDLGSVVLMALRKEPERRYPSVARLAEDVERYLAGRTVAARPDSLWYRGRTFARRHRFAVLFAGLLFAALVAFSATTAVQARRIAAERDRANREAEIAGQVSRFLTELFKVSDPSEARGNTVTAREILDRGSAEIDRRLPEPSLVRARLQRTMGEVYESLGLFPQAVPLLEGAESTAAQAGGERHLETVAARVGLGRVYLRMGRYEEAGKLLRPALEARREALGEEHPETLDVAGQLASLSVYQGRNEEAEVLCRRILEVRRRVQGPLHPDTLASANSLATALFRLGRLDEAEALYREVFEGLRRLQGPDHPRTLITASNLGSVRIQLGRLDEAEPLLRDTIERRRRVLGAAHPATLTAESNLAGLLEDRGQIAEAEALQRRIHEGRRAALGAEHPRTLDTLFDIAYLVARDPARRHLLDGPEFAALAGRSDFEELRQEPPSRDGQK